MLIFVRGALLLIFELLLKASAAISSSALKSLVAFASSMIVLGAVGASASADESAVGVVVLVGCVGSTSFSPLAPVVELPEVDSAMALQIDNGYHKFLVS
mmetsp:Transcript_3882/g.8358  ORF Transcript_3882/g.8358 Transcript_3882/m.8358 type:complete len:100 (-) Transcript_3882:3-302(-)